MEHAPSRPSPQQLTHLAAILDAAELGIWEYDHRSGRMTWSARLCATIGIAATPTLDFSSWFDRIHPDDCATVQGQMALALQPDGPLYEAEYRFRHGNGHWIWMQSRGRVVERDAAGQPLLTMGTMADITGRKRAGSYCGWSTSSPRRSTVAPTAKH